MTESRDPQPKSPLIMRILAGILGVLSLIGVIIEAIFDHGWTIFFQAICQLIFAYLCIAYALGDPVGAIMGKRASDSRRDQP